MLNIVDRIDLRDLTEILSCSFWIAKFIDVTVTADASTLLVLRRTACVWGDRNASQILPMERTTRSLATIETNMVN